MKLLITEEFWSICIRTGRSSVKKTAQKTFECVVGMLPPFERGKEKLFDRRGNGYSCDGDSALRR